MAQTLDELARSQIKGWIDSTGITQTALGERIGRNAAWVSRYLKGDFDADLETLQKIGTVFGLPLTAMLNVPKDPEEAEIIRMYRALRVEGRVAVRRLLEELTRGKPRGRGPSRR